MVDCKAAAAAAGYTPPSGQRVYVITSPGVDLAGWENWQAIGGDDVALPEIAHEFGHGIGLEHSWSNDTTWKDASWAGGGEYDNPWDLMSAANVFVDPTGAFGGGPPFLDAHHLDELGWIPKSRIFTLGNDGVLSRTVTLAALTHPEASGNLLVRIPFDGNDRFHYYTVEYRTPDSWDAGIPASIVMINEVQNNGSYYQTSLIRQLGSYAGTGNGPPVQSLSVNGVNISVTSTSGNQATITVSTTHSPFCVQGYVWRAILAVRPCLRAGRHAQPGRRRQRASRFAPRGQFEHLPARLCLARSDPRRLCLASPRRRARKPGPTTPPRSAASCRIRSFTVPTPASKAMSRDADDSDYVCVSGNVRSQAAADNAAAPGRISQLEHLRARLCLARSVPRRLRLRDRSNRTQAANDNAAASGRLVHLFAANPPLVRYADASMSRATATDATAISAEPASRFASRPNPLRVMGQPETPAPVSEAVLRVRLQKLGYSVQKLELKGQIWEATVNKNGATQPLQVHAQSGAMRSAPASDPRAAELTVRKADDRRKRRSARG